MPAVAVVVAASFRRFAARWGVMATLIAVTIVALIVASSPFGAFFASTPQLTTLLLVEGDAGRGARRTGGARGGRGAAIFRMARRR